ncbi:MAG: conserved rane protein of unknown function [Verrucomicrobiales bacterium]|nr:conserved rane protein of unknown function [Verrucomicrobiales bacterium]
MDWLLAPHNTVFAAAFVTLLCFALLEAVSLMMGLGFSEWLSDLLHLPDSSGPDAPAGGHGPGMADSPDTGGQADSGGHGHGDADSGTEAGGGFFASMFAWLGIGRVPVLVSLCVFLAAFSIGGMTLQQALLLSGSPVLVELWAAAAVFFPALLVMRFLNRLLGRVWPKDETSAFPPEHLVGWVGVVTIGTATEDRAAEVRVTGPDRRPHYVMCRVTGEPVSQGGEVLLLGRDPATGFFRGRLNTNPDLSPKVYS